MAIQLESSGTTASRVFVIHCIELVAVDIPVGPESYIPLHCATNPRNVRQCRSIWGRIAQTSVVPFRVLLALLTAESVHQWLAAVSWTYPTSEQKYVAINGIPYKCSDVSSFGSSWYSCTNDNSGSCHSSVWCDLRAHASPHVHVGSSRVRSPYDHGTHLWTLREHLRCSFPCCHCTEREWVFQRSVPVERQATEQAIQFAYQLSVLPNTTLTNVELGKEFVETRLHYATTNSCRLML